MNTTWHYEALKKFRPVRDLNQDNTVIFSWFESLNSTIPVQRSTNWANKPTEAGHYVDL